MGTSDLGLSKIIQYFAGLAAKDERINSFGYGPIYDVSSGPYYNLEPTQQNSSLYQIDVNLRPIYPLMWVEPIDSNLRKDSLELKHKIHFVDLVEKDNSNRLEVMSDTLQSAMEVKAFIFKDFFYDIFPSDESVLSPVFEKYDDELAGHVLELDLQIDWHANVCDIPGLYPSGATFNAGPGYYSVALNGYLPLNGGTMTGPFDTTSVILSGGTNLYNIFTSIVTGNTSGGFSGWTASTGVNSIIANNNTNNTANGSFAIVGGHTNNGANSYSFIGNGYINTSLGNYGFIGNGVNNITSGFSSVILNGNANRIGPSGTFSVIGNGNGNYISNPYSFIGNGKTNISTGVFNFIGGGNVNNTSNFYSIVVGGTGNKSTGSGSIVVGGRNNSGMSPYSITVGGNTNASIGSYTFIGNGQLNVASGNFTTVVGGYSNIGSNGLSFIGGGSHNKASGNLSVIVGGYKNSATTISSNISGGRENRVAGNYSSINGGWRNINTGNITSIVGGLQNNASGNYGSILGGIYNINNGNYSAILAGKNNKLNADHSFILGSLITGNTNNTTYIENARLAETSGTHIYSAGTPLELIFQSSSASTAINGTPGTLPVFLTNNTIGDSILSQTTLTGLTVAGSVSIYGDVLVTGTASTFNTQTVQTKDNNITMNLSGSHISALYGGINVLSGVSNGVSSTWTIDANGAWSANTGIFSTALTINGGNIASTGGGLITSGGTDLYNIFLPQSSYLPSRVQNGLNTYTGGTATAPTINVSALTVNSITVSGNTILSAVTATTEVVQTGFRFIPSAVTGYVFTSDANGNASWQPGSLLPTGSTELHTVISILNTPPTANTAGDYYLIGTSPTGVWSANTNNVAGFVSGSTWTFTAPVTNNTVFVTSTLTTYLYNGTSWVPYQGTAILQNGNTLGNTMNIGTNDNNKINFKISGNTIVSILTGGTVINGNQTVNNEKLYFTGSTSFGKLHTNTGPYSNAFGISNTVSQYSFVAGSGNTASGILANIGGGQQNTNSGLNGTIAGGRLNTVNAGRATVGGGQQNSATTLYSTIGGGRQNNITVGAYSTIAGGKGGSISAALAFIGGGNTNTVSAQNSSIIGGLGNAVTNTYSFLGGGTANRITSQFSSIIGGRLNTGSSQYSVVIGGSGNTVIAGNNGTILNGISNVVNTSANYSLIGNGRVNSITTGKYSVLLNGRNNSITGNYSVILNGKSNSVTGSYSAILGGTGNTLSGSRSVLLGVLSQTVSANDAVYVSTLINGNQTLSGEKVNLTGTTILSALTVNANVDIAGSTASKASLRIRTGSTVTSPNEGDIWNDSTQRNISVFTDGIKQYLSTNLYVQTSDVTIASSTAETSVMTSNLSLPANFFTTGKTIELRFTGFHSAVSNPNVTIKVKLGSTTILTTGTINSSNSTNAYCDIYGVITCRTIGTGGTVSAQGFYREEGSGGNSFPMTNTSTISIDTTTSQTLDATLQWGTSSASNTATYTTGFVNIQR